MKILHNGSIPSLTGPAEWFSGKVRIDGMFNTEAPVTVSVAMVTFEPGARTAWHSHPLGQTLIVTTGCGRVQLQGEPMKEIKPGDIVWIAPSEIHWHGAAPETAMTHIAIQEAMDGKAADWFELVSDKEYTEN
ncbi:(R)-mandelonitrile lyase [Uliginosibacterium gangwonense]|uniref:(R)-mandelonitrile lyase n=1 Tax=Uliginosibacterium gangwonense TaxID=392736 RepID=UPI000369A7B4|nr:cupin domain-containing protein [Uliginosibacterium gangwonense]